jgi:TRAP-type uncharacterized transport system fused permease subunit
MPFLFIYTPILNIGWNFDFILTVIKACIALVAWGAAFEGYLLKETAWFERLGLFAAALGLLHEGIVTDIAGAAIFALVIVLQKASITRRKNDVPNKVSLV